MKCTDCNEEVSPVVAFDIDGTMGRYHDHLWSFMQEYFGKPLPDLWDGRGDWEDYLGLTRAQYQEAKLAFRQGGFKRWMPTYLGAAEAVSRVRKFGAEVWITTTRPFLRLDSVDPDTREWLTRNKIWFDHLLYDELKYARMRTIVGEDRVIAVVEDLPKEYERAQTEFGHTVPILMERQHNSDYRSERGLLTMKSMAQVGEFVTRRVKRWKHEHA